MLRALDAHDDLVGADRARGERRAVEHEVRLPLQQRDVLATERLAFGAVHDDDRTAGGQRATARILSAVGKPGAAAAAQARTLDERRSARVPAWCELGAA